MKEAAFLTIHKSSKINDQSRFYHLKKTTTTKTNKQANKQTNTKKTLKQQDNPNKQLCGSEDVQSVGNVLSFILDKLYCELFRKYASR